MGFWSSDSFSMLLFILPGKGLIVYDTMRVYPFAPVSPTGLGHAGDEHVLDKIERIGLLK